MLQKKTKNVFIKDRERIMLSIERESHHFGAQKVGMILHRVDRATLILHPRDVICDGFAVIENVMVDGGWSTGFC